MEIPKNIMNMLEQAAFDSLVECSECGNPMEADCPKCGECGSEETLRKYGLI